jgi:ribonucleoside-diphosphate reductase alpha chain
MVGGQRYAVTAGFYPDGRAGEVFIAAPKVGTDIEAILRDGAILMSFALQHGAPLDQLMHAMTREASGEMSSVIGRLAEAVATLRAEDVMRLARAT